MNTIKKSLFGWLRNADAPAEDLESQLEQATDAHARAQLAVDEAIASFDRTGDDAAADALELARTIERRLRDHVERAQRLVDAAERASEEAQRAALEKRCDELRAELAPDAVRERQEPLARSEAELLIKVALIRARRFELEMGLEEKRGELARLLEQLNQPAPFVPMRTIEAPTAPVVVAIGEFCASRPGNDRARREAELIALALSPRHAPFGYRNNIAAE